MQATSIRLDEDTLARLDSLAGTLNCSRAELIKEALNTYLEHDAWVRAEVQKGLDDLRAGRVVSQAELDQRVRDMGIRLD